MKPLVLGVDRLVPADVARIAFGTRELHAPTQPLPRWVSARAAIDARLAAGTPIYGVTTGFGASCDNQISATDRIALVKNLFRYHGCGVGALLSPIEGAAVLICRLAQLGAGWSGIRPATLDALLNLLHKRVIPCIPELGSVGASGDLTPLSYIAAVLEGEREATFNGAVLPAIEALHLAGLAPYALAPKESLSIMNGTSVMTALGCLAVERSRVLAELHAGVTALVVATLGARAEPFDARIFAAKPHPGSVHYAANVRAWLDVPEHPTSATGRIQDPYSIRCSPHVVGVLLDALTHAENVLEIELNGAGDNPLICAETGDVLHGGNFYGGHVAYVCDALKATVASAAEVSERQLMLLTSPYRNNGLAENLVIGPSAGANGATTASERAMHHGFKAMEILSSSLVAEAMKATMPAASFSRSTEGHNQDKVSMGSIAARDLRAIVDLAETVVIVTLLAATQAADLRGGRNSLPLPLRALYDSVRVYVAPVTEDRRQDLDIARLLEAYRSGALARLPV